MKLRDRTVGTKQTEEQKALDLMNRDLHRLQAALMGPEVDSTRLDTLRKHLGRSYHNWNELRAK
jgi:hypothetical protein